jgi:hypothetical protein
MRESGLTRGVRIAVRPTPRVPGWDEPAYFFANLAVISPRGCSTPMKSLFRGSEWAYDSRIRAK